MFRIGVIADTHNFLDPKACELFAGVDHILHAGDIGLPKIVLDLERIAPVTAVQGNTDDPRFRWRLTEVVELAGLKFLLQHIVNPHSLTDTLKTRVSAERPRVVVFGHTHKAWCETIGTTLYFNPGYAGKHKLGLERSVAILHCARGAVQPEFLPL
jgi:hypothetical protein